MPANRSTAIPASWRSCSRSMVMSAWRSICASSSGETSPIAPPPWARMASMDSRAPTGGASVGPNLDMASFSLAGFRWCTASWSSSRRARREGPAVDLQLLAGLGDVRLVLEEHVERLADQLGIDLVLAQEQERLRPVDGLGDRRRLLQLELPDGSHDARDLLRELVVDVGDAHPDDVLLALEVGIVEVQIEAAALQRLRELACVVRGHHDQRPLLAGDRAQLRDRHLEVRQHLEQERFRLDLDPVDLVDEEHDRLVGADRLQQRPGE